VNGGLRTPSATEPAEPEEPAQAPFDAAVITDSVIAKDAAGVVAQLGDPVRVVDDVAGIDETQAADAAAGSLSNILLNGETFKPGQDADYQALQASSHPEFGGAEAVVLFGSQGTLLSFLPGAFYRTTA